MKRDVFVDILKRAPGIEGSKNTYKSAEDHRITMYLALDAQPLVINDISSITLDTDYVEFVSKDAILYVTYESVQAVSDRPQKQPTDRKAGPLEARRQLQ